MDKRYYELVVFQEPHKNGEHVGTKFDSIVGAFNTLRQIAKDKEPHLIMVREVEEWGHGCESSGPVLSWTKDEIKLHGKEPV